MPFPFQNKSGATKTQNIVSDDLAPELSSKPSSITENKSTSTIASMQEEYRMQNSELNNSSVQHTEEVFT